jgi:hypothetical protein
LKERQKEDKKKDISSYWITKETRRYWKLKEEALDHTVRKTHSGKGYRPVVKQTT